MDNTDIQTTNIFHKVLVDRFIKLGLGMPDPQTLKVMEKAADDVTQEVKAVLAKQYDQHLAKKRKTHKELSSSQR